MRWLEPRPGSRAEPGILKALSPTSRHDVRSGSAYAGEAARNDGRGRGKPARRALAGDLHADGELAGEDSAESSLTDGNGLAEGRFLGHKSSLF